MGAPPPHEDNLDDETNSSDLDVLKELQIWHGKVVRNACSKAIYVEFEFIFILLLLKSCQIH